MGEAAPPHTEFRILGPLEVVTGHGPVEIGAAKERALLTLLLIHTNQVVSVDRLIDELWTDPPDSVNVAVRVLISRLRKALADVEDASITTRSPGYVLEVDPAFIDLTRFEELAAKGRAELGDEDAVSAATTLRDALALWRGPALADALDAPSAIAESARLEEQRLSALEDRLEADLLAGRHAQVSGELDALIRSHALRERLWKLRMLSLYRSGRQADALAAFTELRERLAEELGIDPSPEVAELHRAILAQAPDLTPVRPPVRPETVPGPEQRDVVHPPDELPEGTVTILVTDVVGSTALRVERGDLVAQGVLRSHAAMVRARLAEHGGREVKALGDGFIAVFGSVRRALSCAVAVQRAVEDHERTNPNLRFQVRIGLSSGEVVREDEDLFGEAVNAAARIAEKANGGQILVAEVVRQLAGSMPDIPFEERGEFDLKGFPAPWRLFEVVWQARLDQSFPLSERTEFVGREEERDIIRRILDRTLSGHGGLVLIGGEPGVGKTRLAEEMATEALAQGASPNRGRCYDVEGAVPYTPFVEILELGLRRVGPEMFRLALGEQAGELARIMPQLRRLYDDLPPPMELPAEQERRYLFNSMVELLGRNARSLVPLVLVLDDLQWADEPTLLLLEHLAGRLDDMPVLVIGTYRDVDLAVSRPLAKTLEELQRRRLAERIHLKPLPEDAVAAMLRAIAQQEAPPALVKAIYQETEGNPFFVEEVFKHLSEEGRLFDDRGRFRDDLAVDDLDVPESVRLLVGRRLERLGEEGRKVLTAAAVIGRDFTFDLLEAMGETDPDALLDIVDDAERAQLIVSNGEQGGSASFAFAHELVRQTLVEDVSLPRRQRLHLRVADAMEKRYPDSLSDHASEIVGHLYQAGPSAETSRIATYLTLAADRALDAAAFEDAVNQYEQALGLLPEDDGMARARLLGKLARTQGTVGRWEIALSNLDEAVSLFEARGAAEETAALCWEVTFRMGWASRWFESLPVMSRGLAVLGEQTSPNRARLLAQMGVILTGTGDFGGGRAATSQAEDMAIQLGDERIVGDCLQMKAAHLMLSGHFDEAIESALKAADIVRSFGVSWGYVSSAGMTANLLWPAGRFEEARRLDDEIEPLAHRIGHLGPQASVLFDRINDELASGPNFGRCEDLVQRGLAIATAGSFPLIHGAFLRYQGLLEFWRGRWEEALPHFRRALEGEVPGALTGYEAGTLLLHLANLRARDEALHLFESRRTILPTSGEPSGAGHWSFLLSAVEAMALLEEREEVSSLYPLVLEALELGQALRNMDLRLVETLAGVAAASCERWDASEDHFEKAIRQADELPVRLEQPEVRRFYSMMLRDRDAPGDREHARKLLGEAVELYREFGMPKHVELCEAQLRRV